MYMYISQTQREKKQILHLISLVLLQLKGNPWKHFTKRENRWITNYTFFTHYFFCKEKFRHPAYFKQYFMHHAFNKENFKPHHTLPFYKIHASYVNFGLHHVFLVNPLPISYSVVISEWTTVHTYHAKKLMGILTNVWVMHYVIIFKILRGWGEEMLENSFGKNKTMGSLKGISYFALKISKSTLFTVCHTSVMKISLTIDHPLIPCRASQ